MFYQAKRVLRKVIPSGAILAAHKIRAMASAACYGFPSKKLTIIGVAGTKGKTTTSNLITRILEEDGRKVAMFSTANIRINGGESLNYTKMTTPSPHLLQSFLAKAVKAGAEYAIIETSSHGLKQNRQWSIKYKAVVITNLMADHLDYHKTADDYRDTHLRMIGPKTEFVIISGQNKESRIFKQKIMDSKVFSQGAGKRNTQLKIFSFGEGKDNEIIVSGINSIADGTKFNVTLFDKNLGEFNLKIPGGFNVYNSLGAIGAAFVLGIPSAKIKSALEKISAIHGRMEEIKTDFKQDFKVIVDYAHSPDSLKVFYEAVTGGAEGRIIAVLGGTGDRDKTYRAKVGVLADEFADIVIVTNEDPYSEDPEAIIDQVMSGIKNKKLNDTLFRISERGEAIEKAVNLAKKGDIILITGKGSEQCIVQGDKKIPWDDRKAAEEAIKKKFSKGA